MLRTYLFVIYSHNLVYAQCKSSGGRSSEEEDRKKDCIL